jgi:TRAP-type C4-dicarboxylate transport system substrate-binding protein
VQKRSLKDWGGRLRGVGFVRLGRLLLGAAAAGLLAAPPARAADYSFETPTPSVHPANQTVVLPWAREIERQTSGRVKLRFPD